MKTIQLPKKIETKLPELVTFRSFGNESIFESCGSPWPFYVFGHNLAFKTGMLLKTFFQFVLVLLFDYPEFSNISIKFGLFVRHFIYMLDLFEGQYPNL